MDDADAKLTRGLRDEEYSAAQTVRSVLGGTWEPNDTGAAPSQFDVLHLLDDGRRIALEVTSEGDYGPRKSRHAINKRTAKGDFDGASLRYMWHIDVPTTARIANLSTVALEATLRDFEAQGLDYVHTRGAYPWYGDPAAQALLRLGVDAAIRWNVDPPDDEPKILVSASWSVVAGPEALPNALARVLARHDNQQKLAAADVDERHLYLYLDDYGAAAALRPIWTIPACPPDPHGVVDTLWVYAPSESSAHVHRVTPGSAEWRHYVIATGEQVSESALRESSEAR
jgi:hypothetical protein